MGPNFVKKSCLFVRLKEILVEIYNDEREEQIEKLEIKQRFLQIEF